MLTVVVEVVSGEPGLREMVDLRSSWGTVEDTTELEERRRLSLDGDEEDEENEDDDADAEAVEEGSKVEALGRLR